MLFVEKFERVREAFNDQAFISFPVQKLNSAPSEFWQDCPEEEAIRDGEIIFACQEL